MGCFSWCTSDTRKSVGIGCLESEVTAGEVYLLNPFGEPYRETDYNGYGVFGGQDVYALVAKWNAPEQCKDENGDWLPDDEIRDLGIYLACYNDDHVQLQYPIKIVEHVMPYEEAEISPHCPFQGCIYDERYSYVKEEIECAFQRLDDAKLNYDLLSTCIGKGEKEYYEVIAACPEHRLNDFKQMIGKHKDTPENVLVYLTETGNIYLHWDMMHNPCLTPRVLEALQQKAIEAQDPFLQKQIMERLESIHKSVGENEKKTSLDGQIVGAKEAIKNQERRIKNEKSDKER